MDIIETNEPKEANSPKIQGGNGQKQIAGAILVAGILIAGAILIKGKIPTPVPTTATGLGTTVQNASLLPVSLEDRSLGNIGAKVTLVEYADFQCPFCGRFFQDAEKVVRDTYVKNGSVRFVYRDYAFLGDESIQAAEAARCANDQGKFWEYHDYLFTHQNGENKGTFSNDNLKSFAKNIFLDTNAFNNCLDSGKYLEAVNLSATNATKAGVRGTPKGFILRGGKIVDTIDGAEPGATVKAKIDAALK